MKSKNKSFSSSTAEIVCLLRAKSFNERREYYKSDDYISVLISNTPGSLPSMVHGAFIPGLSGFAPMLPAGIYEFIIARTRYVDKVFQTLPADTNRVFILGAGYDSRGFRFRHELEPCRVYECDHPDMQKKKKKLLKKMEIDFPDNVGFIPIDFSDTSFDEFISTLNIKNNDSCFFLLEGLLMYLPPQRVERILRSISAIECRRCRLFFDYVHAGAIRGEDNDNSTAEKVKALGEPWRFGIEPGEIGGFLRDYGFTLREHLTARDMELAFFTDARGQCHGQVMGSVALALAERAGHPVTAE